MNHKRKGPKSTRSGCLLCKPHKLNSYKTADRMKGKQAWKKLVAKAY